MPEQEKKQSPIKGDQTDRRLDSNLRNMMEQGVAGPSTLRSELWEQLNAMSRNR
jgi:hypothetical protein